MRLRVDRLTFLDVLLVVSLVVLPVWALVRRHSSPRDHLAVEIRLGNRLYGAYPLERDALIQVADRMTVEIRAGSVRVRESNCPKGICRHTGWRSTPGSTIICLPNRIVITITGQGQEYDVETR
ncbi:MAG: NusG domain II-containing protein [candidate division WOR-3 bacterium]